MSGRIRSIKPEWLEDEKIGACSDEARLLSVALLLVADDHGNGRAHPQFLAGQVWAYSRDPQETLVKVSRAIRELVGAGFIALYEIGGQNYFTIRNWARHQRVDHAGKPRVPGPANGQPVDLRETLVRVSRESRETLAPDLRPPTSDLRPPGEEQKYVGSASSDPGGSGVSEQAAPGKSPDPPARPPSPPPKRGKGVLPLGGAEFCGPAPDPEAEVFDVYLAGWADHHRGKPNAPALSAERRKLISKLLKGGLPIARLKAAARGAWLNAWHVEQGQNRAEQVFRSTSTFEKFEGYALEHDEQARGAPVSARPPVSLEDLAKPVGPPPAYLAVLLNQTSTANQDRESA